MKIGLKSFILIPSSNAPNLSIVSYPVSLVLSCLNISFEVFIRNGSSKIAPTLILSSKLYKTFFNLSLFSSLAKVQGAVSSIYLLHLLKISNILSKASGISNLSVISVIFF